MIKDERASFLHSHVSKNQIWKERALNRLLKIPLETFNAIESQIFAGEPTIAIPEKIEFSPKENTVYFSNGTFLEAGPCQNLVVLPLSSAMNSFQALLLQKMNQEKENLSLFNQILCHEGVFLYLPAHTRCNLPVRLLFQFKDNTGSACFGRLHIFLGQDAHLKLIFEDEPGADQDSFFHHRHMEIHLEQGAHLDIDYFSNLPHSSRHHSLLLANCKEDAHLSIHSVGHLPADLKEKNEIALVGAGAEATIVGAYYLTDSSAELEIAIDHRCARTTSLQKIKGAIGKAASFCFKGKIGVERDAIDTKAYQLSRLLLLTDCARGHSEPSLDILTDEIKATHGSTIGLLNDDELFYLTSRGIRLKEAKQLLTLGFLREDLNRFNDPKKAYEFIRRQPKGI